MRVVWQALTFLAITAAAVASFQVLLQVFVLFLLVTIGEPGAGVTLGLPRAVMERFLDLRGIVLFVALAHLPTSLLSAVLIGRLWGRTRGVEWGRWQVILASLALSYRFPALLSAAALAVALLCWHRLTPKVTWVAWAAVVLLGLNPYEVSLQVTTGPPHLAPAVEGTPAGDLGSLVTRGQVAYVGGCTGWYYAPRWVWVW
jgi:hypothetical protein